MDKLIYYGGIGLMVIGFGTIISAIPLVPQAMVSVGPISAEVSEMSATRIIVGVTLMAIGFLGYKKGK